MEPPDSKRGTGRGRKRKERNERGTAWFCALKGHRAEGCLFWSPESMSGEKTSISPPPHDPIGHFSSSIISLIPSLVSCQCYQRFKSPFSSWSHLGCWLSHGRPGAIRLSGALPYAQTGYGKVRPKGMSIQVASLHIRVRMGRPGSWDQRTPSSRWSSGLGVRGRWVGSRGRSLGKDLQGKVIFHEGLPGLSDVCR